MNARATTGLAIFVCAAAAAGGCRGGAPDHRIPPRKMADAVYTVLSTDRAVYTREVVRRLQDEESVIKASEHFRDDKALPLPAQMFRMGAEAARKSQSAFTYALLSPWPINKQNAARTDLEKSALQGVVTSGQPAEGEESLGGARYFTVVYPDKAVNEACVDCHNQHRDSPRHDFKVGDTMGGVVIRIALR